MFTKAEIHEYHEIEDAKRKRWTMQPSRAQKGRFDIGANGGQELIAGRLWVKYARQIIEAVNAYDALKAENERLREALKLCQVRVYMAEGSENEAYQKAVAALGDAALIRTTEKETR